MGLLLSILVSCVGVIELIAFYGNIRRALNVPNSHENDLENITLSYKRLLGTEYRHVLAGTGKIDTNFALNTSPNVIFNDPHVTSSTTSNIYARNSNQINEVEQINNVASTSANIYFDVINTATLNHDLISSKGCKTLIESSVSNQQKSIQLGHQQDIVILNDDSHKSIYEWNCKLAKNIYAPVQEPFDVIHGRRSSSPFPTYELLAPRGSASSELSDNQTINVAEVEEFDEDEPHTSINVDIVLESKDATTYMKNRILIERSRKSRSRARSSSPYNTSKSSTLERSRSKSPESANGSKSFNKHTTLRSSYTNIPNHLEEKSTQNPLDEFMFPIYKRDDLYTPSLRRRRTKSSSDATTTNCTQKSSSNSQLVAEDYWRRSPSPFRNLIINSDLQYQILPNAFDEDFKNTLDGIKSRNEERKREFRRKRFVNSTSKKPQTHNNEGKTTILNDANAISEKAVYQNVYHSEECTISTLEGNKTSKKFTSRLNDVSEPSTSKDTGKQPEAFWVNQNR